MKKKAPRCFEIGDGEGYHSLTVQEHYHTMYFEALDYAVSGIKEHFDQPGYKMYKYLEQLLVKLQIKRITLLSSKKSYYYIYGDDFDESELATHLQVELIFPLLLLYKKI